jgi:hypothetical protein
MAAICAQRATGIDGWCSLKRLKVEDVDTSLHVWDERIGVREEIRAAHNKTLCGQLANHVPAAGAGLEDRAFDLDRTAERRDNPVRVEGDVSVALEALKAAWRDVAKIGGCRCGSWVRRC